MAPLRPTTSHLRLPNSDVSHELSVFAQRPREFGLIKSERKLLAHLRHVQVEVEQPPADATCKVTFHWSKKDHSSFRWDFGGLLLPSILRPELLSPRTAMQVFVLKVLAVGDIKLWLNHDFDFVLTKMFVILWYCEILMKSMASMKSRFSLEVLHNHPGNNKIKAAEPSASRCSRSRLSNALKNWTASWFSKRQWIKYQHCNSMSTPCDLYIFFDIHSWSPWTLSVNLREEKNLVSTISSVAWNAEVSRKAQFPEFACSFSWHRNQKQNAILSEHNIFLAFWTCLCKL